MSSVSNPEDSCEYLGPLVVNSADDWQVLSGRSLRNMHEFGCHSIVGTGEKDLAVVRLYPNVFDRREHLHSR